MSLEKEGANYFRMQAVGRQNRKTIRQAVMDIFSVSAHMHKVTDELIRTFKNNFHRIRTRLETEGQMLVGVEKDGREIEAWFIPNSEEDWTEVRRELRRRAARSRGHSKSVERAFEAAKKSKILPKRKHTDLLEEVYSDKEPDQIQAV